LHHHEPTLHAALTLVMGDEVPASHLFAEFRDYARKNPTISAADHLRSLHSYGGVFEKFQTGYNESSREGQFFYRLEALETTTFFPLREAGRRHAGLEALRSRRGSTD
jgi:hypothetical protein